NHGISSEPSAPWGAAQRWPLVPSERGVHYAGGAPLVNGFQRGIAHPPDGRIARREAVAGHAAAGAECYRRGGTRRSLDDLQPERYRTRPPRQGRRWAETESFST